eukprot:CAMPEP_0201675600 /NCGR_PEP_ID=MMETSP0494-20130426/39922_1 /ASSEMBLY_ACC=CAM_ASM_000839 /TAXON_ID=420259 /ORGANISM="Thalassiosira gravida, Strain GMp14c1" /LENGTH=502 /DNA_ID=CAMNT_0048158099 /DNA_START=263 /DNA_END=1771 /DNA_ORIENTATION=+
MANDGGLRHVLQTSERVSNDLFALSSTHQPSTIDLHQNNGRTAAASSSSGGGAKNKRKSSRSLSEISGNTDQSIRMDLSQHTSDKLKRVVMPLIRSLEKLDAAALLSLNPSPNNHGSKGTNTSGKNSNRNTTDSNFLGATLDPSQNLTVTPIHDRITPHYNGGETSSSSNNPDNIVRYLHVREVPHKYSIGIFIFPPNAEIPLHDHPDMVVLSRVLYGELLVRSYDVLPAATTETLRNIDRSVGNGGITHQKDNNSGRCNGSCTNNGKTTTIATSSQSSSSSSSRSTSSKHSALRSSLHKIKSFVSRALSYNEIEGAGEPDDNMRMQGDSVLRVKPNLKPMGVQQKLPQDDDHDSNNDHNKSNLHRPSTISAPSVTCLYPHEGNCHAFVAGPQGAAILDVLLPPYDSDDDRDCTFYEPHEENNQDHSSLKKHKAEDLNQHNQVSCATTLLTPIDQPDDFHCLSGVYGRFGSCDENNDDDDVGVEEGDHDGSNMSTTTSCNLY